MVKSLNVNRLREEASECPLLRMSPGLLEEITNIMQSDGYKLAGGMRQGDWRSSLLTLYFTRGEEVSAIHIWEGEEVSND